MFVLTHHARPPLALEGGTSFTFVTDDIAAALEQARRAARGKDVSLAVSRTRDELSITVLQRVVPQGVRILLSIAEPLAEAGLSIFTISTYDTDYVLLKARDVAAGVDALRKAGHQVIP